MECVLWRWDLGGRFDIGYCPIIGSVRISVVVVVVVVVVVLVVLRLLLLLLLITVVLVFILITGVRFRGRL